MIDFAQARRNMIDCQVRTFEVTDLRVLSVMEETPREPFVPTDQRYLAYSDHLIEIRRADSPRRWLLPPMVLARLLQALAIEPGDTALDAGPATGYGTALIGKLGGAVTALEPDATLVEMAGRALGESRVDARVVAGPVAAGWPQGAPFDAILLNGAFEVEPQGLLAQLGENGRLVGIDAGGRAPQAVILRRAGAGFSRRPLFDVAAPVFEGLRRLPTFAF